MSKVIQIAVDSHEQGRFYALRDDGTMWRLDGHYDENECWVQTWVQLPPIPEQQ